jgi:hypothetical protein
VIDGVLNKPQRFSLRESIEFKLCKRDVVLARSSMLRLCVVCDIVPDVAARVDANLTKHESLNRMEDFYYIHCL